MTIRARLFASYVAIIALSTGVLASFVVWSFDRFFLETVDRDLGARALAIAENVGEWLAASELERVQIVVRRYGAQESITLRVLDTTGALLATSLDAPLERTIDFRTVPGVPEALAGQKVHGRALAVVGGREVSYVVLPIVRDGKTLGVVRMSRSLTELRAHEKGTIAAILVALAVVVGLCAVISNRFAVGFADPIQRMRNFAVRLGQGHLHEKVEVQRKDEIGELAVELNHMSSRLSALEDERRAFLANVSHELRTPVSNTLVTLQALESGAGDDPELRARFLGTALAETERMRRLITDLLDLGAIEAGVIGLDRVQVALSSVIDRCCRAMESRAAAKGVSLKSEVETAVEVRIDPERITQAVMNVLDNAVKFAPEGTAVTVIGRVIADGRAEIRVTDRGRGIAASDLPHVFEQFYTADRSRQRGGGTGLGLAIARRIVDAHDGEIAVESEEGAGATFIIRLPVERSRAAA